MTSWRPALGLAVVGLGTFAAPLDSAVNIAFPSITGYFGREVHQIRWVIIAYVLTYASLLLVFGRLGDLIGYRRVFRAGLAISALGFLACSAADQFGLLLFGRTMQGFGIALVLSCAPALATSLYPESQRTRILAIYAAMSAFGAALGPFAGGILVGMFGWPVVFWARVPLVVIALLLSGLVPAGRAGGTIRGLDLLGSLLLVAGLALILLGWSAHSTSFGVMLPAALMVSGALVMWVFIRQQGRHSSPIIRLTLFRDSSFTLMNLASIAVNMAAFSVVLLGPFFLVRIARLDAATAGVVLSIGAMGAIAGSWIAVSLTRKLGSAVAAICGALISAAGLGAMALWTPDTEVSHMALALACQGVGLGIFQVAYADIVTATLPVAERGVAGSLTMLTRTIGIVGGAAGHTLLHRVVEATHLARGATPDVAFMAGYSVTFATIAGVLGVGGMIAAIACLGRPTRS